MAALFSMPVKEYSNIVFTAASARNVQFVVWGMCIGFFLASLFSLYQRFVVGIPVRRLLSLQAFSAKDAKTAAELGLKEGGLLHRALAKNAALKKLLKASEEEPPRYHIPEELKYRAEIRYEKKGNPIFQILLCAILSLAIGILLIKLIPLLLLMVDAIL